MTTTKPCTCCNDVDHLQNEDMDWTVAHMAPIPKCDICNEVEATVDAATNKPGNYWAYMCADCWETHGRTPGELGLGIGQRLIKAES